MKAATMKILFPSILFLAICVDVTEAQQGQGVQLGNPARLQNNGPPGLLNTARGAETAQQKADRMAGLMPAVDPIDAPEPNIGPFDKMNGPYGDPVKKAKCLNERYDVPVPPNSTELYEDYMKIFKWGFQNNMGRPIQSRSLDNNKVTNNRFPSMFTRMCFHDNSIDSDFPPYDDYVRANLKNGNWVGPHRYLDTSGADASVLICPEERYHPNQNYDQTASRVLYALQATATGITRNGDAISMLDKWGHSYADLLHNGCVAAAIFLTQANLTEVNLDINKVFRFGRKDACHLPSVNAKTKFGQGKRFSLCGPTELLPGVLMEAEELNKWFYARGMKECTWLALMWTHTVMVRDVSLIVAFTVLDHLVSYSLFSMLSTLLLKDNMATTCPLKNLPASGEADCMDELDKYRTTSRIYFQPGDALDYFKFFLNNGTHVPTPSNEIITLADFEKANCKWKSTQNGRRYHWPMTRPDCVLGYSAVEARALIINTDSRLIALKDAIKALGDVGNALGDVGKKEKTKALLYALSILSGDESHQAPAHDYILGCNFTGNEYPALFGAYWGDGTS